MAGEYAFAGEHHRLEVADPLDVVADGWFEGDQATARSVSPVSRFSAMVDDLEVVTEDLVVHFVAARPGLLSP